MDYPITKDKLLRIVGDAIDAQVDSAYFRDYDKTLVIELSHDDSFSIGFAEMKKVAEAFQTEKIDVNDWSKSDGCVT